MERRLRRRKTEERPSINSDFEVTGKQKSNFSMTGTFNSETLSNSASPKLDNNSTKRIRRKKIRCTQDFNHLHSSITSQDSDESTHVKTKKTKRSKRVNNLPKISVVVEDFTLKNRDNITANHDKLTPKKEEWNTSEERNLKFTEQIVNGNQRRRATRKKKKIKENENLETMNSQNYLKKDENFETSVVLKGPIYSEVETISNKRNKLKKLRKSSSIGNESNVIKCSKQKIKMSLNDQSVRKSNGSNDLSMFTPLSDKKQKRVFSNNTMSTEGIKQTGSITCVMNITDDNQKQTNEQTPLERQSQKVIYTPHNSRESKCKHKLSKTKQRQSQSVKNHSKFNSKNSSPRETVKKSRNVSSDLSFGSVDIFNETFGKQLDEKQNNIDEQQKSFRFESPSQNIRRETLILSKSTLLNTSANSQMSHVGNDDSSKFLSKDCTSVGRYVKRNSTFEIDSSEVVNQIKSLPDVTQSHEFSNVSLNPQLIAHSSNGLKRKSAISSPIGNIFKSICDENNEAILYQRDISLTRPISNISVVSNIEHKICELNESKKFDRESTFTKSQAVDKLLQNSASLSKNTPKLNRSATFTRNEKTVEQPLDLSINLNYDSPIEFHTLSTDKPIDTSKVNTRRRWDKSRLSNFSFADNSVDIKDISAPWQEGNLTTILDVSSNDSLKSDKQIESSHINNGAIRTNFNNPQIPSGTSTPFPKSKTNQLGHALLKDKKDLTNEKKKRCIEQPVPKFTRTKIPNFALIHQKALDKLENLQEMSERKAARAKLLLSGRKPPTENHLKSSTRKELNFNATHLTSSFNKSKNSGKTPNKSTVSITKVKNISPSKSNPRVINKENKLPLIEKKKELLKSQIPKPKPHHTFVAENNGYTRFGFKIGSKDVKKPTKDEQLKALTAKTKIIKNTIQERRNAIQGVRSNRRFELLMSMRNK